MGEVRVEMLAETPMVEEVEENKAKKLCNATNVTSLVTIKMNARNGKMQISVK
jgi:hypothetical protein